MPYFSQKLSISPDEFKNNGKSCTIFRNNAQKSRVSHSQLEKFQDFRALCVFRVCRILGYQRARLNTLVAPIIAWTNRIHRTQMPPQDPSPNRPNPSRINQSNFTETQCAENSVPAPVFYSGTRRSFSTALASFLFEIEIYK